MVVQAAALGAGIFGSMMNRNSVRESNAANERLSWSQVACN